MIRHIHYEVMMGLISDMEGMEWRGQSPSGDWTHWTTPADVFPLFHPSYHYEVRKLRGMARQRSVDVPAPELNRPKLGALYCVPSLEERYRVHTFTWDNNEIDQGYLENGLVYLTPEDALERRDAMLNIGRVQK